MSGRLGDATTKVYEIYIPSQSPLSTWLFQGLVVLTVTASLALGLFFSTVKPRPEEISDKLTRIRSQFLIREEKKPEPKKGEPKKKVEKKESEEKVVDLTKKPEMARKVEDIPEEKPKPQQVRRVYGLRKVYSKGLGSGGALADAVIGKLGNTLNKDFDTLTATDAEIKGQVVSTTTVTTAPRITRRVKPSYTREMIDNRVEGVVKVKVLVDIDGKVKKAQALNDIGYGAAQQAMQACLQLEFEPAKRGSDPVAVWIIVPIRFVLLG